MERRARLGWEDKRYAEIVKGLLRKRIVKQVYVSLGRERPEVLYQMDEKIPSIKHQYYVYWILEQLTGRGYVCRVEKNGPDIVVPKLKLAIQVELGSSKDEGNIRLAQTHYDKVIVCSDDAKVLEHYSRRNKDSRILFLKIEDVPRRIDAMQIDADRSN